MYTSDRDAVVIVNSLRFTEEFIMADITTMKYERQRFSA